ncbi:MAG: ribosome biogenesis GTPase Der [Alphaproteobacteria bacterium]|nr:ribosome biogenesis GTPase Der [Alphaproteobacteria bacterium]
MTGIVAIIGRPNVGKSTLFNRLVGKKLAIVHDMPGVTRDRREGMAEMYGKKFKVIDTAGLEEAEADTLEAGMWVQTERALDEADVGLMLIDARAGITPMDSYFADIFRKSKKPVIVVANKCEGRRGQEGMFDAYSLGLGEPIPVSAEHGTGISTLFEAILPFLEEADEKVAAELEQAEFLHSQSVEAGEDGFYEDDENQKTDFDKHPLQLAIVGRPNVGKSTLVNCLLKDERMLTGPIAGVTRDSIAVDWEWQSKKIKLVDTAGLRRQSKMDGSLERLSAYSTKNAIDLAQVVVLVLDADAVLEKQDLTIARKVIEEGRALVIAVNKWDAAKSKQASLDRLSDKLQTSLTQVKGIPTVTMSALRGRGMGKLMKEVFEIYEKWNMRISTSKLNNWLSFQIDKHPPPLGKHGLRIKLRYMTQAKTRPPTFALFGSTPESLPKSYERYLINSIRQDFGLEGVPIRLNLRKGKNPYAK